MITTNKEETREFLARNTRSPTNSYTFTLRIEKLRLFALVAIVLLFGSGQALKACIFTDIDEWYPAVESSSGSLIRGATDTVRKTIGHAAVEAGRKLGIVDLLDFNFLGNPFCEPYIEMKKTFIWTKFGFPHTCSFIDHNPFKEIMAVMLPLFTLPMTAFLLLAHYRIKVISMNNVNCTWVYTYSKIVTPFNIFVMAVCHLWFVNDPEKNYPDGYGFVGHYVPYALFQTSLSLVAIQQLWYYIGVNKIPFGVPVRVAQAYVRLFLFLTICYQAIVITILMDKPILDSAAGGLEGTWQRTIFVILTKVYTFMALVIPIILSARESHDGIETTFIIAHPTTL
jgi:hypothetical protein